MVEYYSTFTLYILVDGSSVFSCAQHLLDNGHSIGPIEDIMETIHFTKRGQIMDTLERFHIFREAQIENQINNRLTVRLNIIFDVIVRNDPHRGTP
jgi:hypothetical protein